MQEAQEWIQEFLIHFRQRGHSQKRVGWISEQKEVKSQRQQEERRKGKKSKWESFWRSMEHYEIPTPPPQPRPMWLHSCEAWRWLSVLTYRTGLSPVVQGPCRERLSHLLPGGLGQAAPALRAPGREQRSPTGALGGSKLVS